MAKRARKQGGASEEATLAGEGSSAGPAAAARESTAAARHDEDACKGEKRRAGAAVSKLNEIDDIFASKPKQAKTDTAEKAEKALGDSSKGNSQSAAVVTVDTSSVVRACVWVLWWLGLVCMLADAGSDCICACVMAVITQYCAAQAAETGPASGKAGRGPKVKGSKDDLFGAEEASGRKKTEEGYKIYTEDELGFGKYKGGDSDLCPFDCDCCF